MARRAFFGIDKTLFALIAVLIFTGALIFSSAVLGVLARGSAPVSSIMLNHLGFGVGVGLIALIATAAIHYRTWKTCAPYLYGASLLATALVFVPHIGFSHGGATRWLLIGPLSIQPAEALKLGAILAAAAYFAHVRSRVNTWVYGVGGFVGILVLPAALLILQPDTGTFGVICFSVLAIYFSAGAKWQHIVIMFVGGIVIIGALAFTRPYIHDRLMTLLNPRNNPLSSGYQIRQSFIAIGSGGIAGRGFGQSIQKYSYLPEPVGDSIFAVASEEFGFLGALILVLLYLGFCMRSFKIATHSPDMFGSLLAIGIGTYLAGEAFVNIASMVGLIPVTGVPLTFISQGGSAILVALASAGILLNISRTTPRRT